MPAPPRVGQAAWTDYASDLLVVPVATVPWSRLVTLVVAALVAVTGVALFVAQLLVKRSAARELRTE